MQNVIESLNIRIGGKLLGEVADELQVHETYGGNITWHGTLYEGMCEFSFYSAIPKDWEAMGTITMDKYGSPFALAVKLLNMKNMEFPNFGAFAEYLQKEEN